MINYKPLEDVCALVNPFLSVMNKEHGDYLLLYGKGIIKKKDGGEEPYMILGGLMELLKASLEVKNAKRN
ncbi:hypothetical protein Hanom_Chr12g01156901 [Helianthus anomalus]